MAKTVEKKTFKKKLPTRKRVAAYARVSSAKDAMHHSLSAQVGYYSNYIQSHSEWQYAGVYADEAETVRRIFREYLDGKGTTAIANGLNADGIPTRFGNGWPKSAVSKVLRNYFSIPRPAGAVCTL